MSLAVPRISSSSCLSAISLKNLMMSVKSMFLRLSKDRKKEFFYIFLSPVNDDVSVGLHKAEGNEEPKLGGGNLSCCPDCLPDPVHMRVAELSLEIQEKPGEKINYNFSVLLLIGSNLYTIYNKSRNGKSLHFPECCHKVLDREPKMRIFSKRR